jgi:hypothetical protein
MGASSIVAAHSFCGISRLVRVKAGTEARRCQCPQPSVPLPAVDHPFVTRDWQMPTTPIPHGRMVRVAPVGWRTATMVLIVPPKQGSSVMKTILSALIALSVLGSVAVPASAGWDTKKFWENLENSQGGGN